MVDIIFFALLAAFLIYRLRSVLGRKDFNDINPRSGNFADSIAEKLKKAGMKPDSNPVSGVYAEPFREQVNEPEITDNNVKSALENIRKLDRDFSAGSFLEGANIAFEMVLKAFNDGDRDTLKNLLSDELYQEFSLEIDSRSQPGKKHDTTLVSILSNDISRAKLSGKTAEITVRFVSEQIDVVKDDKGAIIAGNPSQIVSVKDIWVFSKDLSSSNPNWTLIDTTGHE